MENKIEELKKIQADIRDNYTDNAFKALTGNLIIPGTLYKLNCEYSQIDLLIAKVQRNEVSFDNAYAQLCNLRERYKEEFAKLKKSGS